MRGATVREAYTGVITSRVRMKLTRALAVLIFGQLLGVGFLTKAHAGVNEQILEALISIRYNGKFEAV